MRTEPGSIFEIGVVVGKYGWAVEMNDPAASGQRDAGPEWQLLSLLTKVLRDS